MYLFEWATLLDKTVMPNLVLYKTAGPDHTWVFAK